MREKLNLPRGERYELCRSVHSEANAIISASRKEMIGGTMYLVGKDFHTGEIVENASSCAMCKRMIINSGIERVIVRLTPDEFKVIPVSEWIEDDDSLEGKFGYL